MAVLNPVRLSDEEYTLGEAAFAELPDYNGYQAIWSYKYLGWFGVDGIFPVFGYIDASFDGPTATEFLSVFFNYLDDDGIVKSVGAPPVSDPNGFASFFDDGKIIHMASASFIKTVESPNFDMDFYSATYNVNTETMSATSHAHKTLSVASSDAFTGDYVLGYWNGVDCSVICADSLTGKYFVLENNSGNINIYNAFILADPPPQPGGFDYYSDFDGNGLQYRFVARDMNSDDVYIFGGLFDSDLGAYVPMVIKFTKEPFDLEGTFTFSVDDILFTDFPTANYIFDPITVNANYIFYQLYNVAEGFMPDGIIRYDFVNNEYCHMTFTNWQSAMFGVIDDGV